MTETQERIKAYKAMLPGLKERVLAVALLLVVSVTMMTSATFAWLTISRAPEVTGVSTTVAANGNLEIALATSTTAPGDSKVGDSSASQAVTLANLTWGNLINLSDPSYGLDNLVLRPAQLNLGDLRNSPLYGAVYSEDGRIEYLTSNFSYTSWVPPEGVVEGYFGLSNNLGVRAVSSTKREVAGFYGTYLDMKDKAVGDNTTAGNAFAAIAQNNGWMTVLAKLMGIHMTATLNYEDQYINAVVSDEDLEALIAMYNALILAYEQEAVAIAKQLNLQLYAAYGGATSAYTEWTDKAILALAENDSRFVKTADAAKGLAVGDFAYDITIEKEGQATTTKTIKISQLQTFIKDYNMLKTDVAAITTIKDGDDGRWTDGGLKEIINKLVKIDDCLVKKTSDSTFKTVKELLAEFSNGFSGYTTAMGYMNSTCDVVITNGVLKNFEQRTGGAITVQNLPVTATMYVATMNIGEVSATIKANITTSATAPADYLQDNDYADTLNTGADNDAGTVMAQDTYALAVDLWVRTNAQGSYLTLEGNVLYDEGTEVVVTGKDANGNTVELYTLTRTSTVEDSTYTKTYTLYQVAVKNGETKPTAWYNVKTNAGGTHDYVTMYEGNTPTKTGKKVTVNGVEYDEFTLTRTESYIGTQTIQLYKKETTSEDGTTTTTWYRADTHEEYIHLEAGDEPKANGSNGTDAAGNSVDYYSWDESIAKQHDVSYTLYQKELDVVWYNSVAHSVLNLNDGEEPNKKMETIYTIIGYEGENRVWNGEDKSYISTDATTQGSGSCYVYYADTPEDQARSLELLAAMNVAFIGYTVDEDGTEKGVLLATASMDTTKYFAEGGRVTVPLVLNGGVVIGEDDDGNAIYSITSLEKNVATRITALVYLNGTFLGNENVLAASDIQGRLNIQFGSSLDLHPIDNEDLENDELRVSATVDETNFDYDTHVGDMKTTVTVNVDGDQPNTMTAFFLRQISSTQGSREKEMTFTKQADGTWKADYTFDAPGVYILRSVRLDGQDYDLATMPTVTITGFNVSSLTMSGDGVEGRNANVMTAANSATVDLSLKFATNDPDKMPKTVQGRFLREDGTAVNVNFTYNPTTQDWSGSATFLSSGDYTFEFLVLDGEYVELDEGFHQTATITLGMRVAIYTTSPLSFKYLPSEMTENQKLLGMQVKIMDNTGKEMEGLQGAKLYYRMQGSPAEMDTDLTWNAASGYYIGELKALESGGAGVWQFSYVTVGGNTLTNATTSPTFTLISPEPPSFNKIPVKTEYQFAPNGDAIMQVDLNYSATAKVFAVINGVEVEGKAGSTTNNATTWSFAIPKTNTYANNTQDGRWTMEEIKIWNYYTADGDYIAYEKEDGTQDEPMVIDLSGQNYTTKVVQTVNVSIPEDKSQTFTGNNFMGSYTLPAGTLSVSIKDFEGKAISNVSDVKMTFSYKTGTSQSNGGYTMLVNGADGLSNATPGATVNITLTDTDGDGVYTQNADATFLYAGQYENAFSVSATGYSYTATADWDAKGEVKATLANLPVITVKTNRPTVRVTGISPTAGSSYRMFVGSLAADGTTPEATTKMSGFGSSTYSATVYIYAEDASLVDSEAYTPLLPKVTLSITGMPTDKTYTATMSFANAASSAYNRTFTFTNTATSNTQSVGGGINGQNGLYNWGTDTDPKIFPAGKQTVDSIAVTYNGVSYDVDLTHAVTINQPQYPPYADFVIADSRYSGTVPGRVYSTDGEHIVLPDIDNWTNNNVATALSPKSYPDPTTSAVGTYYYDRGWWRYYTYTRTMYTQSCTVDSSIDNITYKLQWKVGSTLYEPGTEIAISRAVEVTAVVSEVSRIHVRNESVTYTKTWYTFAQTGTSKSGTEISFAPNASTKYDASNNVYDESEVIS